MNSVAFGTVFLVPFYLKLCQWQMSYITKVRVFI